MRIMSAASSHRSHSRSQAPHSAAADAGHCMITVLEPRRSSRRMDSVVDELTRGIGTSTKALDVALTTDTAPLALAPAPSRSQRRTRLALRPWASATPATDAPGCWQARTTWLLSSGAWLRRVRFAGVLCIVSTCLLGGHYPHGSGWGAQDAFTGRIRRYATFGPFPARPEPIQCFLDTAVSLRDPRRRYPAIRASPAVVAGCPRAKAANQGPGCRR